MSFKGDFQEDSQNNKSESQKNEKIKENEINLNDRPEKKRQRHSSDIIQQVPQSSTSQKTFSENEGDIPIWVAGFKF